MYSIFLDTSENLTLGLLDRDLNWIDFLETKEKKGSGMIHGLIYELLAGQEISLESLKHVYLIAGPGSYTGMRLAEGVAQVLELNDRKVFSTYHFDIPELLGVQTGIWASKAFKGEIFTYFWDSNSKIKKLYKEDEFWDLVNCDEFKNIPKYTHFEDLYFKNFNLSSQLVREGQKKIFSFIKSNELRKKPYYYRPLELEFKPSFQS